jgi:hypothetical protein
MKSAFIRRFAVLSLAALLMQGTVPVSAAFAYDSNAAKPATVSNQTTTQQVQAALDNWGNALASRKPEVIVPLYAPNAVLQATLNNTPITNQEERTKYFTSLMAREGLKVEFTETIINVINGVGIANGLYTFSFQENGKTVEVPARFTYVLQKGEKDNWLIIAHHSSMLPIKEEVKADAANDNKVAETKAEEKKAQ